MIHQCCVCGEIISKDNVLNGNKPGTENDISHGYCKVHFSGMIQKIRSMRKGMAIMKHGLGMTTPREKL